VSYAPSPPLASHLVRVLVGLFLAAELVLAFYVLLITFPPTVDAAAAGEENTRLTAVRLFGEEWDATVEGLYVLLVSAAAAIGASIHALTSYSDFVGNRRFMASWVTWYIVRVPIGVGIGIIIYFAIRGGLLNINSSEANLNPYGIAGIAALSGLMSKQIVDKLRDWADNNLRTTGNDARFETLFDTEIDSVVNPVPVVTVIDPASLDVASTSLEITLRGEGFVPDSLVSVSRPSLGGEPAPRDTSYVNSGELKVMLEPADAEEGSLSLTVFNPSPGGGNSEPVSLQVALPSAED